MIETSLSFKEINVDPWIFVQSSWQLVFWPPTGKCYQIFSQGPCPPTQVDRLPHQLLIMRMTFRSLDSPRTVRSQSAGKILFLSPKLFPQVSPDSTHPLAGHRPLLQVTDIMCSMSFSTPSIFQATQSWSLPGHAVPGPAEQSTTHLSSCPANPTRHSLPALCPLRPVQARTRLLAPGRPVSRSVQPGPLSQR